MKDDFTAFPASLWTYVYNPVGSAHHILIMLYDDDRITDVAEFLQRIYEFDVVALVKSDAWLVKYVENINQLTSYLRCKPYALALTSGKGSTGTV